jgi:hypothetical protein
MTSNHVSITNAADMIGITRATLYKHIEEKGISIIKEGNAHPKIDVSELIRVYGDNLKMPGETKQKKGADNTTKQKTIQNDGDSIETALLEQKLEHVEELKRLEVRRLEDQIQLLEKMLDAEKEEKSKINLLLTDQREKTDRVGEWEQSMKALESRVANQEDEHKKERDKILRHAQALQKALDAEKNKSLFQQLFG